MCHGPARFSYFRALSSLHWRRTPPPRFSACPLRFRAFAAPVEGFSLASLMTDEERFQMVSACKWVDTVQPPHPKPSTLSKKT